MHISFRSFKRPLFPSFGELAHATLLVVEAVVDVADRAFFLLAHHENGPGADSAQDNAAHDADDDEALAVRSFPIRKRDRSRAAA